MKIKELTEILKNYDPESEVVLQRDAEGNGYMSLYGIWSGAFDKDNGEAGFSELTPELKEDGYTEEDILENGKKAIFLWG